MQFRIMMTTPNGETLEYPMASADGSPHKAIRLLKKYQGQFGPGYKFFLVPA